MCRLIPHRSRFITETGHASLGGKADPWQLVKGLGIRDAEMALHAMWICTCQFCCFSLATRRIVIMLMMSNNNDDKDSNDSMIMIIVMVNDRSIVTMLAFVRFKSTSTTTIVTAVFYQSICVCVFFQSHGHEP